MRTMTRGLAIAALAWAVVLFGGGAVSSGAMTEVPAGPRLAVVVLTSRAAKEEMLTIGPAGERPRTLVGATSPIEGFLRPIWSPDGERLTFLGHGPWNTSGIYLARADGSSLHRLKTSSSPAPGTLLISEPVFDPATGSLVIDAMTEPSPYRSALWSLPIDGAKPHRLTPWTSLRYVHPYSITPSGTLVAEAEGIKGFYVGTIDQAGGHARTLVKERDEGRAYPMVSPDGTEVAYVVEHVKRVKGEPVGVRTDLMLVPIDGGAPRRIATVEGKASWPSWDPSGSRLVFTAEGAGSHDRAPSVLMEVNADGSCLGTLYRAGGGGSVLGAAWQPGSSRGAGPISCGARRGRGR
jgi:hypothetical protein